MWIAFLISNVLKRMIIGQLVRKLLVLEHLCPNIDLRKSYLSYGLFFVVSGSYNLLRIIDHESGFRIRDVNTLRYHVLDNNNHLNVFNRKVGSSHENG